MSLLRKLGEKSYDHALWVIGLWVAILIILGVVGVTQYKPLSSAITIPGTEAGIALDRVSNYFPDFGKGQGRIVIQSPDGFTEDNLKAIDALSVVTSSIRGVNQTISPGMNPAAISKDGKVAYIEVLLSDGRGAVPEAVIQDIDKQIVQFQKTFPKLTVERSGDIVNVVPGEILGVGEVAGVILALVVLVVTLGALAAAGMPIIIALIGVGVSMGGLFALSRFIDMSMTTPVLAVMLGLAVGIDYSLFIITKYRSYLKRGLKQREAAGYAVATAGNAVVFAALTVIIALAALTVVQIPFMSVMGLAASATIAVAALLAITFLPALFRVFGLSVLSRRDRSRATGTKKAAVIAADKGRIWYKIGEKITNWKYAVILVSVITTAFVAWPVRDLTLGLPTDEFAAPDKTQRQAYDILKQSFGVGFNAPLLVVVDNVTTVDQDKVDKKKTEALAQMQQLTQSRQQLAEAQMQLAMAQATTPEAMVQLQQQAAEAQKRGEQQVQQTYDKINKQLVQYKMYGNVLPIIDTLKSDPRIESATPALVSNDHKTALIQIIPKTAPSDPATKQLISDLRTGAGDFSKINHTLQVTGSTALEVDINAKLAAALPSYLSVVIGLSFVLLLVAFRSVAIPIVATLGFLMSLGAMFGFMVAAFQWGWFGLTDAPGPIVSFVPIIGTGILFGLAMDYQFFLVSGMHETYRRTKDVKHSVAEGFSLGAKVIVAAALIMVSIFAAFVSNPDSTIQSIGMGLAVGIAVDAFIVRLLFTTAVMQLLGKAAWWIPDWLDKLLPRISIEGDDSK